MLRAALEIRGPRCEGQPPELPRDSSNAMEMRRILKQTEQV
jgi:hypothetical protein